VGRQVPGDIALLAPDRSQQRAHAAIVPGLPGGGKTDSVPTAAPPMPWAPGGLTRPGWKLTRPGWNWPLR